MEVKGSIPGGSWGDRKASFKRCMLQLFKKQWLYKVRSVSSLLEILVAWVLYIVLYPIDYISIDHYEADLRPNISYHENWTMNMMIFWRYSNESRLGLYPECFHTKKIADMFSQIYLSGTAITPEFATSKDNLLEITEGTDANGLGIHWINAKEDDALTNPKFDVICHSLMTCPDIDTSRLLRMYISNAHIGIAEAFGQDTEPLLPLAANFSSQRYPRLESDVQYDLQYVYSFIIVIPIVIATMPDFGTIMDEKDSHIAAFAFMNGCPEGAYWLVMYLTPLIISFVPYAISSFLFCYWYRMLGNDISLMLVLALLFCSAHCLMQMWISTLIKVGANGRSMTIVIFVLELFLAFIHKIVTLDAPDSNVALKHVFSIIPFSCYQMIIGTYYYNGNEHLKRLSWNNLNEPTLRYPLWIGLLWLVIDNVLYLLLFIICNACNSRSFGTPIIRWSELFNKDAWRRVFRKKKYEGSNGFTGEKLIDVHGLKKSYRGKKIVNVFDDTEFYINAGEVIVIIGPNGAGKSTLVNMMAGAIEPDDGRISFNGQAASSRFRAIQDTLGVVFQDNVIFEKLSVREHLEMFGAFKGIDPKNIQEAIDFFAENLQLTAMLDNYAGDLSGGQKRKLCIAISLLGNPPIVIMDEPTAGVDVQARQLIWKTIASLTNTTSIVTSHALEEAETVSSRLFIVADHCIPFCGTSTELRSIYKCGYLLRVDREDGTAGPVLELAQSFIPDVHLSDERKDTIRMPVDPAVGPFLKELNKKKDEFGVKSYSFAAEQLEDLLLKMIETGESLAVRESCAAVKNDRQVENASELEDLNSGSELEQQQPEENDESGSSPKSSA